MSPFGAINNKGIASGLPRELEIMRTATAIVEGHGGCMGAALAAEGRCPWNVQWIIGPFILQEHPHADWLGLCDKHMKQWKVAFAAVEIEETE